MSAIRHPVVVVSHGPGPLWLLTSGFEGMNKTARPAKLLLSLFDKLYPTGEHLPKRILLVSAHFESDSSGFEISNAANPEMIYDYYGFPEEAYDVVYPAKGDPAFAQQVKDQLEKNNLKAKLVNRGFDHGAFVPMTLIRPQADIPVVSMSINSSLSNEDHFNLGRAIAGFRDEDTLIICSGQSTHNLRRISSRNPGDEDTLIICSGQSTHNLRRISSRNPALIEGARAFQSWLDDTLSLSSSKSIEERTKEITTWQDSAPAARLAHPSPDHFMPFVVAAGAGMEDKQPGAQAFFGGWWMGPLSFANYAWGIQQ